jgi:DNA repair ATPase RecN
MEVMNLQMPETLLLSQKYVYNVDVKFEEGSWMARARNRTNGRLEEALATLLQNQATLVQNQAAFVAQLRERDREMIEMQRRFARIDERFAQVDQRFAQIDQRLANIESVLREYNRILERLPDAVREKIGFKAPP